MMKEEEGNLTRHPNLVGMTNISNTVSMNDTHTASEICYQCDIHWLKHKVDILICLNLPICLILCCRGTAWRKISSLQDRICVPTNSVEPNILWVSSARFTPPMAATSLMSSSPL